MDQEQARNGPGLVQGIYMTFPSSRTAQDSQSSPRIPQDSTRKGGGV